MAAALTVQEIVAIIRAKAQNTTVTVRMSDTLALSLALWKHIPVAGLHTLLGQYSAPIADNVLEKAVYYEFYCLWDLGLMPSVVSDLWPGCREREHCDTYDDIMFRYNNDCLKLFCCRPACMRFRACYCGDQLPLRHVEYVLQPASLKHRLDE